MSLSHMDVEVSPIQIKRNLPFLWSPVAVAALEGK